MPRIAFFEKQGPVQVGDKKVCQCGLSKDFPFCDSSHHQTKNEDKMKVYQYVEGQQMVIGELHAHDHGGCSCGECHCGEDEDGHCECGGEHVHHEEEE